MYIYIHSEYIYIIIYIRIIIYNRGWYTIMVIYVYIYRGCYNGMYHGYIVNQPSYTYDMMVYLDKL